MQQAVDLQHSIAVQFDDIVGLVDRQEALRGDRPEMLRKRSVTSTPYFSR